MVLVKIVMIIGGNASLMPIEVSGLDITEIKQQEEGREFTIHFKDASGASVKLADFITPLPGNYVIGSEFKTNSAEDEANQNNPDFTGGINLMTILTKYNAADHEAVLKDFAD
jgi:hypothetical protein